MDNSTIAIIGAGNVGAALAKAFILKGKTVIFGVNNPDKYRDLAMSFGKSASVTTAKEAVSLGAVVVLAVPYAAAESVAKSVPNWQNKILVDATNPLAEGLSGLTVGTTSSGAEEIAKLAKGARVVKAFNTTGAENMADSCYAAGKAFMPVCGNDAEAKGNVMALAELIGFDAVDLGDLKSSRYLEPFAMTWIHLAILMGQGRSFAFGRLSR